MLQCGGHVILWDFDPINPWQKGSRKFNIRTLAFGQTPIAEWLPFMDLASRYHLNSLALLSFRLAERWSAFLHKGMDVFPRLVSYTFNSTSIC